MVASYKNGNFKFESNRGRNIWGDQMKIVIKIKGKFCGDCPYSGVVENDIISYGECKYCNKNLLLYKGNPLRLPECLAKDKGE